MKFGHYLCAAVSLLIILNRESFAQNQAGPRLQNAASPKSDDVQPNPYAPAPGQIGNGVFTFDYPSKDYYYSPGTSQYQPQAVQGGSVLNWEKFATNGQGSWLAVSHGSDLNLAPADDALRDHLKLSKGQGLVVTALDGNSPAARAGVHQNDVLVTLGDAPLGKPEDLEENLKKAGEKPVTLALIRNGERLLVKVQPRISVTLGPVQTKAPEYRYWIGVEVGAIDPVLRSQLQIRSDTGVIVNNVLSPSPAEKAGVKVHDILLDLDGKPLSDPRKLAALVQAHGQKPIVATLLRAGSKKNETVEITPEQRESSAGTTLTNLAGNFYFVRPGALVTDPLTYLAQPTSPGNFYQWTTHPPASQANPKGQKAAEDSSAAVSKRLDALDAEIKRLRKAVEGLRKTESIIDDLNKAVESLNKAAKENK
jgi:membrane-associated protease RseP (regulator of RpoE activity)